MALPTSPPISLNQIKAEFGATGTRSLTEFYRGGAFVPNIPANSGVPTSGSISLLNFLGASAYVNLDAELVPAFSEITQGPSFPPPPSSVELFAGAAASPRHGTGSYTYVWTIMTGNATANGGNTSQNFSVKATVLGNGESTGQLRCVISDGVQTITRYTTYTLRYIRLM